MYKELNVIRDKLVAEFIKPRSQKDSVDFVKSVKLFLTDVFLNHISPEVSLDILTCIALEIMKKHPDLMDADDEMDEYVD